MKGQQVMNNIMGHTVELLLNTVAFAGHSRASGCGLTCGFAVSGHVTTSRAVLLGVII